MNKFDVIVIGAGTSGMMAAVAAAENGANTLLLEKNKRLGKKLLLTGGGRCNVTNAHSVTDIIEHIPGNGKFLYSAFHQFDNQDIQNFFLSAGVKLKEEDHGRIFPVSNRSQTIVDALAEKLRQLSVIVYTDTVVTKILTDNARVTGVQQIDHSVYSAPCVIIATGGKTYRSTGSTGDGYEFAKRCGHSIQPLYPTEVPLISEDRFIKNKRLQGLSLQNVALSVLNKKGRPIVTHKMDLLFTHFGLSGPAALRCSTFVVQGLKDRKNIPLVLDIFPDETDQELMNLIQMKQQAEPQKSIKNGLKNFLPERLISLLLEEANISENETFINVPVKELEKFMELLKNFPITITATWPLDKAFVTGGGITLKEIEPKTMASRLVSGLFFTGEVLNINGYTGGYNITAAFVTGHVAGVHAAKKSLQTKQNLN